jgi:hypothetical protein
VPAKITQGNTGGATQSFATITTLQYSVTSSNDFAITGTRDDHKPFPDTPLPLGSNNTLEIGVEAVVADFADFCSWQSKIGVRKFA